MKRTLYLKLLGGYLLFGLLGFLIIATFTYHLTFQHLEKKEAQNLYRESALISSSYAQNYFSNSMTLDEINEQLSALDTYLNADIWIVDTHGKILINTAATETTEETIPDFDMTDFGNRYYRVGTFYDYFQENMLSVFSPITVNYKVRGYVIIHKSESYLTASANSLSAIAYTTLALIFAAAFVVLALFTYVVYIPIRKITHAADEYSKGNFDAKIDVHSNDEIGYLAASLNYMANELNTLEEDQRKFISNVSHDFRSPLTSIKGYVEAMLDGTIPVEMQEKYLNIILFETERLNKLTKSLLELNKFGSHGVMLDVTDFDINQTIKTTLLTFEGICANKHIRFNLILSGEQLFVTADFSKIQQVLYNLIDNAIKFSHPDSTITIETTEKNDKVFVSVKDTGIGIPKDSLKKIWERFYKTDLSRGKDKRIEQSAGYAMSVARPFLYFTKGSQIYQYDLNSNRCFPIYDTDTVKINGNTLQTTIERIYMECLPHYDGYASYFPSEDYNNTLYVVSSENGATGKKGSIHILKLADNGTVEERAALYENVCGNCVSMCYKR